MRVLHVTDTFLPRLGGIELHVADLACRQIAAGDDVLVLTGESGLAAGSVHTTATGVPTLRLQSGITGLGLGARLRRVIEEFRPDVIQAHLTVGSPFTWAVLRTATGIPVVGTLHSLLPRSPALVRGGIRVAGIPARRMLLTAVSEVAADRLRAAVPGLEVGVLHNGIDPSGWQVGRTPSDLFEIVVIGRLAARKRPLVMVEALARLAQEAPDVAWRATFVGDGAQRSKVVRAIVEGGLRERVRVLGPLPREDIREILASADVVVAPATLESFGIAALEARSAGVPVIGMAASGVTEFVRDGVEGLLARDDADLTRCLHRLATDAPLAARIRHHNTTVPVAMSWDRVLLEHRAVYERAISSGAGASRLSASPTRTAR